MRLPFTVPVLLLALAQQVVQVAPQPAAPAQPPRDPVRRAPPPEPTGTASIRGRVVAADTGSPIRRANVSLMMVSPPPSSTLPPSNTGTIMTQTVMINGQVMTSVSSLQGFILRPKSATSDAQGVFEFKDLPAGTYRLSASPGQYSAQYLGIAYGGKRPNAPGSSDQGQPIQLSEGQSFAASIVLPKGSVITGHVSDDGGDPLARIQVYTLFYPPGSVRGQRMGMGGGAQTDDLGQFRIYGLAPGDYVVVAEGRNNTFVQPNAPTETEEERIGMMTTFYPAAAEEGSAQRIRVRQGETSGIEIRMLNGRLLHISGMVTDSQGKTSTRANGQLMLRSLPNMGINSFGFGTDQDGRFQMRNIPPGEYRLVVRQMIQRPPNPDLTAPPDLGEFAVMPISLTADLDNILVTTSPGVTITGQIVYDGTQPPLMPNGQPSSPLRVSAQQADPNSSMGMPGPQPVQVSSDLTFTLKGLMGEFVLRTLGANQYLTAVTLGGDDITDAPHEFKQGDKVTLVVTTRASTVEGTITDDKGQPANDATIVLFGEDKSTWRTNSIRTRRWGPEITGHYRIPGVLPGRYFAIALPRDRAYPLNNGPVDPSFFEQLTKEATSVTVAADEQRQVDLKIAAGSGG